MPRIISTLISGLKQWRVSETQDNVMPHSLLLNATIEQSEIGWDLATRGIFSKICSFEQEKFFTSINDTKLGDSWSGNIILWWIHEVNAIWQLRNQEIHNCTTVESREEKEINVRLHSYMTRFIIYLSMTEKCYIFHSR